MRKQEKAIIWPAYFDQSRTRKEGRRVPKSLAVPSPRIQEISEATVKLGLKHEVAAEAGYPKTPWAKTGMLLVEKQGSKEQTIKKIAKQLLKTRSELLSQPQKKK
ncbi:MAG: signal recognition particle protein Srp19 [Candidatus Bathyarchaeota archaeon]|nr:signal recognition particle protein Srp19 [Candidatus Bathyarchaeota archaeon]